MQITRVSVDTWMYLGILNNIWECHSESHSCYTCIPIASKWGNIMPVTLHRTMLPVFGNTQQHCCVPHGHKKCLWRFSETFVVSATNVACTAKQVNIWETCSRQQCCSHSVSIGRSNHDIPLFAGGPCSSRPCCRMETLLPVQIQEHSYCLLHLVPERWRRANPKATERY